MIIYVYIYMYMCMIIHDCSGERLYDLDTYLMGMAFRIPQGELVPGGLPSTNPKYAIPLYTTILRSSDFIPV